MNILPKLASNIFNTCCNERITKFVYLCQAGRRWVCNGVICYVIAISLTRFNQIVTLFTVYFETHSHTLVLLRLIRSLHLTSSNRGLEEFFDDKENFQAQSVRVGRPWKKEELRLKGNTDLHKLWYTTHSITVLC